jgi:proteic killer suppression protein
MIKSFKHKGLKLFFTKGSLSGIQANHADRLRDRLAFLNTAICVEDMRRPGYRLHELSGDFKGRWAINVSGNWRITFEFKDGDVYIVDYEDYH